MGVRSLFANSQNRLEVRVEVMLDQIVGYGVGISLYYSARESGHAHQCCLILPRPRNLFFTKVHPAHLRHCIVSKLLITGNATRKNPALCTQQ